MAARFKHTLHLGDFFHDKSLSYQMKGQLIAERIKKMTRRYPELALNYDLLDYAAVLADLTGWYTEDQILESSKEFNSIMDDFRDYAEREGIAIVT